MRAINSCDGLYPSGYDVSMADDRDRQSADALNPADFPLYPPADATGDVDLSLIDCNLDLTPAERIRQHNAALELVEALRKDFVRRHGFEPSIAEEAE